MIQDEIRGICSIHNEWLYGGDGARAVFNRADLRDANLIGADLGRSVFDMADMTGVRSSNLMVRIGPYRPPSGMNVVRAVFGWKSKRKGKLRT